MQEDTDKDGVGDACGCSEPVSKTTQVSAVLGARWAGTVVVGSQGADLQNLRLNNRCNPQCIAALMSPVHASTTLVCC
jgi:hypothetical protein